MEGVNNLQHWGSLVLRVLQFVIRLSDQVQIIQSSFYMIVPDLVHFLVTPSSYNFILVSVIILNPTTFVLIVHWNKN